MEKRKYLATDDVPTSMLEGEELLKRLDRFIDKPGDFEIITAEESERRLNAGKEQQWVHVCLLNDEIPGRLKPENYHKYPELVKYLKTHDIK